MREKEKNTKNNFGSTQHHRRIQQPAANAASHPFTHNTRRLNKWAGAARCMRGAARDVVSWYTNTYQGRYASAAEETHWRQRRRQLAPTEDRLSLHKEPGRHSSLSVQYESFPPTREGIGKVIIPFKKVILPSTKKNELPTHIFWNNALHCPREQCKAHDET